MTRRAAAALMSSIVLAACASSSSLPDHSVTSTRSTSTRPTPQTEQAGDHKPMAILFVGNSHTANHDVPALVETLLESDPGVEANVLRLGSSFLRDAVANPRVIAEIESGAWDVVVLQGQEISQSHTIVYSRSEAISLAEMAIAAGSRPLFFAEWSRRGIDETDYIEAIYAAIAETAGAEVIPVGRTWDHFLDDYPDHELWAPDGNHASEDGAFLAAATIASFIAGPDATISVEPGREAMLTTAQDVVAER